jgi:uncharacterized membrane protein YdjX (TVP38/TMEM64 family)
VKRLLPLIAAGLLSAWMLKDLGLDWSALFHGNLEAGTLALRQAAERQGEWRGLAFVAMIGFLPLILVPISLLLLSAAMALKTVAAMGVILGGTTINTALSYAIGRAWGLKPLEWIGAADLGFVRRLRQGAEKHGFAMAIFSRFLPVPFAVTSAAAGVVGIGFWNMILGSFCMMLPWSVVYVFFGEALHQGSLAYLSAGLAAMAALGLFSAWYRKSRNVGKDGEAPKPLLPQNPALGPELTLYTLEGSEACDEAREELWKLRPKLGFEVRETDLSAAGSRLEKLKDQAPLVFLGERRLFSFQVDENALEKYLREARD